MNARNPAPRAKLAAALVVLAAAPAFADEQVQLEVQGKDTVLGTIRPIDEREAIIGKLVAGTVLKAAAKSTQKAGPVPTIQLLKDGAPVGEAQVLPKGRGSTLAPFVVPATGNYKVVVVGDGSLDGDYQLAVNWAPKKTFSATGTSAADTPFTFSVPANSVVSVTLSAAKGSPFVPHLLQLEGPSLQSIPLSGAKASKILLAERGDWTLHFQSDGDDGPYKVTVKVVPPKVAKHKVDIRDKELNGAFGGGSSVFGAVVTPGDGGSVVVDGSGSPIDGSSVSVPPDSLSQTTSIFVAAAAPYTPPGNDHPAGPAVEFGPSGTQFDPDKPATVTIPFDPAVFGGDTSALIVYVKDAEGVITPVLPTSAYVFGPNTVTFTTSHFSTFQAATTGSRGIPDATYTWVEVSGMPFMNFDGEAGVAIGSISITPNGVNWDIERSSVQWTGVTGPGPLGSSVHNQFESLGDGLIQQVDDTTFDVQDATESFIGRLRRGMTDDVLVFEHATGNLRRGMTALLRNVDSRPTINALSGKWHAFVWEVQGVRAVPAGDTTLPVAVVTDLGSAVVQTTGAVTFKFPGRVVRATDLPSGVWSRKPSDAGTVTATLQVEPIDFVTQIRFGEGPFNEMRVCAGGNIIVGKLVGVDRGYGVRDAQVALLLMVRETTGASAAGINGAYVDVLGGLDLHGTDAGPPADALGVQWRAQTRLSGAFNGQLTQSGLLCFSIPLAGDPVMTTTETPTSPPVKFTVAPNGAFASPLVSIAGAGFPAGGFVFYLRRDALTLGFGCAIRIGSGF